MTTEEKEKFKIIIAHYKKAFYFVESHKDEISFMKEPIYVHLLSRGIFATSTIDKLIEANDLRGANSWFDILQLISAELGIIVWRKTSIRGISDIIEVGKQFKTV